MIKKKTKIVATISDKRCDENFLKSLSLHKLARTPNHLPNPCYLQQNG